MELFEKVKFCYIRLEDGQKEVGTEELKAIGKKTFKNYNHEIVTIGVYHNFKGARVVYSTTHSKCQEIIKQSLHKELERMNIYKNLL